MQKIAIIPARGGSKRIPRKNIKPFVGKPIIAYAITTAIDSGLFSEVMVSTEDDEIAEIAESYGAQVPFRRSQKNAGDYAGTAEVLVEVLMAYEARGLSFEHCCCIYPTAPFVTTTLLEQSWQKLLKNNYDSVFPVLKYSYPIQRSLRIEQDRAFMLWPENYSSRTQDLDPVYHDAGQFYWLNVQMLKKEKRLWTDNTSAIVISELQAQDIDTLEDWAVAEFKYRYLREMGRN